MRIYIPITSLKTAILKQLMQISKCKIESKAIVYAVVMALNAVELHGSRSVFSHHCNWSMHIHGNRQQAREGTMKSYAACGSRVTQTISLTGM